MTSLPRNLLWVASGILFLFLTYPAFGADTYVVIDDIAFVRPTPDAVLPPEKLKGDEALQAARATDSYFFYGQNVLGEANKTYPKLIEISDKAVVQKDQWQPFTQESVIGYIDKSKLWKEPPLAPVATFRYMTLQETAVHLLPESKSRQVLALYQGEVVVAIGKMQYNNQTWIKTRFESDSYQGELISRYGYILENQLQPLIYGQMNESKLTVVEIPENLRNFNLSFSQKERERLSKDGFYIEPNNYAQPSWRQFIPGSGHDYEYWRSCDDMADYYQSVDSAIFITSDLYLHSFHKIFDHLLADAEEARLYYEINSLTAKMASEAAKELKSYQGSDEKIKKALLNNLFYFSVAAKLLDLRFVIPEEVRSDAEKVVARINKAEGELPSLANPIDLGEEDFTQYRVRGHYLNRMRRESEDYNYRPPIHEKAQTPEKPRPQEGLLSKAKNFVKKLFEKKEAAAEQQQKVSSSPPKPAEIVSPQDVEAPDSTNLERYFRAMMWYGRHSFLLSDDVKTLSAILMVRAMENSGEIKKWQKIDTALTRLIGKTDDYTPLGYGQVNEKIFGTKTPKIEDIEKGGLRLLTRYREEVKRSLPRQKIVSMQTTSINTEGNTHFVTTQEERIEMTAGFKFLGQRFSWDAYLMGQLTAPSVGTMADPRNLPSALDVMTLLGSKAAKEALAPEVMRHTWSDKYYSQIDKLSKELAGKLEEKDSTYNIWLFDLKSLFAPTQSKQYFALGEAWQYKNLNTAASSWTELKHDTALYAEQVYAELGGEGPATIPMYRPPYVKGYVEPNPLFFFRLKELVAGLLADVGANGLLTDEYADKLQTFESLVDRAYQIAKKEVEGTPISRDDYEWMSNMKTYFNLGLLLPREVGSHATDPDMTRMALIADVATDAVSGQVLEVATGLPHRMFVIVKDAYGGTRITTGFVYSWYEFSDSKRWTDQEWRELVYSDNPEDQKKLNRLKPSWYSNIEKQ